MASALLSKLIIEHTHYFSEVKQTRARGRHALESIGDRQDRFAIEEERVGSSGNRSRSSGRDLGAMNGAM